MPQPPVLCPRCGASSQGLAECPHCGVIFAKLHAPGSPRPLGAEAAPPFAPSEHPPFAPSEHPPFAPSEHPPFAPSEHPPFAPSEHPPFAPSEVEGRSPHPPAASDPGSLLVNRLALPGAFAFALLVVWSNWLHFIMQATFAMEIHELGHATLLWLGSRWAIPLPMFTLNLSGHRSVIAFLLLFGGCGYAALRARQAEETGLTVLFASICALQLLVTLLPDQTFGALVQFAGVGGEFYLSTLLVVAFYYRLPDDLRWNQARWFFLLIGTSTFALNAERWLHGNIPWGSFFGGDGDMDHLRDQFGWNPQHLISIYRWVGAASFAVILGHYLYFAFHRSDVREGPLLD